MRDVRLMYNGTESVHQAYLRIDLFIYLIYSPHPLTYYFIPLCLVAFDVVFA